MRILCFGDSNTYGYDPRSFFGDRCAAPDRWPDILGLKTGWEVLNAGCNGRQIPRSAYPLRKLREQGAVDIFLVMLGTNDLLQGASAREAAQRMAHFLRLILPIAPMSCWWRRRPWQGAPGFPPMRWSWNPSGWRKNTRP